jgi:hypothetical protein
LLKFEGRRRITEVISSMPGGYVLLYLDADTYHAVSAQLRCDREGYSLLSYPSMDADDPSETADPYNPTPKNNKVRYPQACGFLPIELTKGLHAYKAVAAPLSGPASDKFFNIRGVQTLNGKDLNATVCAQTWQRIAGTFDPDNPAPQWPIKDVTQCPGDGVIPAWSARLVGNKNVITVKGDDLEHMDMMKEPDVQAQLRKILGLPMKAKRPSVAKPKLATSAEVSEFVNELARQKEKFVDEQEQRQAVLDYVAKFPLERLQQLMGRAFVDGLKSPSQKEEPPSKPKRAKRPPRRQDRTRAPRKRRRV